VPGRTRPIAWGDPAPPRANLVGYLTGEFGVAEAGRLIAGSALGSGVDLALVRVEAGGKREDDLRLAPLIGSSAPHPVTLVCVNADQTPRVLGSLGPDIADGHYTVGYWHWELSRFPRAWSPAIDLVDEVWTASEFVALAVRDATRKPVRVVPLPVDVRLSRPYTRAEFGLPEDRFIFLFTLDFHSYLARKNPEGLVAAFRAAFRADDDRVALVIKSTNGHDRPAEVGRLRDAIGGDARIELRDGYLGRDEVFGLESVADAYVSLHRSEGFGLGLAESMFLGKPVIATAYSGNLEFMDPGNSCLVGYRLVDVRDGEYPCPEGQVWADPDLEHAAEHMRRLADDPDHAAALGRRAAADVRERLSPARTGGQIVRALEEIHGAHETTPLVPGATGGATSDTPAAGR
jgi:glycosyltransferase involved in cell wall biosynthesis